MKYIKEYKEIDWDNDGFDIEEEDPNIDISIGDTIIIRPPSKFWDHETEEWLNKKYDIVKSKIIDIKQSKDVDRFKKNANGKFTENGTKPDCDCIVVLIEGHWPWFMLEKGKYDKL